MKLKRSTHTSFAIVAITVTAVFWLCCIPAAYAMPASQWVPGYPGPGIMLPLITKNWPPVLVAPVMHPISNSDQDNYYVVAWDAAELAESYVVEESTDAFGSNATVVYQGVDLSWSVPGQGKTPATYSYRVSAITPWGTSPQSTVQSVTIYPLFIGLRLRWDGMGYRRGDDVYDFGTHTERNLDILTDKDTIRSNNRYWYDPNPGDWDSSSWYSYYSITRVEWITSSVPDDPSFKWSHDWILASSLQFGDGQTVLIDGKRFLVTGPHAGYTAFGRAVQYWELVNRDKFLYWDGGGDWKQYVHAGDIMLRYDAGNTRLFLHYDVLTRYYYRGNLTSNTVQYINNLTSSNSFPATAIVYSTSELDGTLDRIDALEDNPTDIELSHGMGLYR